MKKILRNTLIVLFAPLATRLGYKQTQNLNQVKEYSKENLLFNFYSILKKINFTPKHIVDVGANHGTWTKEALKYFPDANYSLFEPQHWLKESIQNILDSNNKVQFHAVGVGSQSGTFKFTIVDRDDSCSFAHSEEYAQTKGFKQLDIPIVTLNEFLSKTELPIPDIIKIDAEGLDLEVLKGASDYLGKTEVFLVEAGVVNKKISNSISEVIKYMDENDYRLFDITDMNRPWETKVLWLVELAFVKKNGIIDKKSFR